MSQMAETDKEFQEQDATEASPPSETKDPNVIDWDGPNDTHNPMNWACGPKYTHLALVSIITLVVNLASTMFAPGAPLLMKDFSVTSSTIGSLTVSIYLLGFALGPLFISPLSELYGRLIIYHTCNIIFLSLLYKARFRHVDRIIMNSTINIGEGVS
ncbi:hypothetical protein K469DRAFT_160912 [Zopfia rhizophila CBS 207.26]|uniref:Major facilitator superfamily (MFS) profile domain-containing protein n=1 Tax=Zopfia rhizophila CBS 207.26 TaxID=1314779 RepID=A0A6A6E409_9PEZI|nr:hypothetical protein K469DRAFT_160912 [Zopfia rhizophila CBS 207.26]